MHLFNFLRIACKLCLHLCYYMAMNDLSENLLNLRRKYREIFKTASEEIAKRVEALRPDGVTGEFFDVGNKIWQDAVLKMFDDEIARDIYIKWQEILAYRKMFSCNRCATCCNLACSEFSPEELKTKADAGDKFAAQFLSVFEPYKNQEEAQKVYPEYMKLLEENKEDKVYFYHCPKLSECKLCTDYENRPQICRDFPDNPLSILPKSCGFYEWKQEVEPVALLCHSMMEIIEFYKEKICTSCRD